MIAQGKLNDALYALNAVLVRFPGASDRLFRRHSITDSDSIRSAIPDIRSAVPGHSIADSDHSISVSAA